VDKNTGLTEPKITKWTDYTSRLDCLLLFHFYSAAALHAMQSAVIPTAIPSVCPSVCHTLVPYPDE